jgi:hypothetical protein
MYDAVYYGYISIEKITCKLGLYWELNPKRPNSGHLSASLDTDDRLSGSHDILGAQYCRNLSLRPFPRFLVLISGVTRSRECWPILCIAAIDCTALRKLSGLVNVVYLNAAINIP